MKRLLLVCNKIKIVLRGIGMILENNYIVVVDYQLESQRIFYNGKVEIEAFKRYKELNFQNKKNTQVKPSVFNL
ncbi:hypothetical protein N4T77_10480 [Clostridium sp. CX1]|uniref:hypothetical protein n=1 Tax=Clostridium sp. CX1 TaxID=2978346 RepID=UPI0021C21350|nr:hypothetical protein [Clostridium sp. CX1]MCT8977028.1 hypothetical protein [Clostridium sp. CX1]